MNKSANYIRKFLCLFFGIVFSSIIQAQTIDQLIKKFDKSIDSLHAINEFNGNILLAKNGVYMKKVSVSQTARPIINLLYPLLLILHPFQKHSPPL